MPSDKTRTSDDIPQGYKGPVMQQGRVILDRDFNALQETVNGAIEADALEIIGPCGTPDDGFAISVQVSSPPAPGLWVPPAPLDTPALHPFDFLISPGTMYAGGQRAVFPAADPGEQPFTYSYFDQPDWIQPDDPSGGSSPVSPQVEFIYLHLFEQEVSAVEDSDLKDVALGGPDTTQRLRLMRRVERLPMDAGDCASALAQARGAWLKRGFQFNPPTMQLLPQAALQVSFTQSATASDPCDPVATGGYLGADNQLIRVQISDAGDGTAGSGKLLWGYDNASFIYRVSINLDGKTLQLNQSPVDAFHAPKLGQVVEVLRTAAILESDPDASDPFRKQTIVRCIAEASGEVRTLAAGYDPAAGTVVLDQLLPVEYLDDATPVFLRVWQAELGSDPAGGTVELTDAAGLTTGVQVTITIPKNGTLPVGAYWMIAVRPSTPQAVYPERFLISPQPPDGPRQWACPLAVIDWTGNADGSPPSSPPVTQVSQDCRNHFDNLVDLTKRKLGGCCAVTIRPEDFLADPVALQKAIDNLSGSTQGAAVCVTPGDYALTQPLRLDSRHSGLTLEACHGAVTLKAAADADLTQFLDGLIVVSGANDVTLHGLSLELPAVPLAAALKSVGFTNEVELQRLAASLNDPRAMVGLRLQDCTDLTVEDCRLLVTPPPDFGVFAAGIFAGGDCTGLTVQGTQFIGPARLPQEVSLPAPPPTAPPVIKQKKSQAKKQADKKIQAVLQPAPSLFVTPPLFSALTGFLMVPSIDASGQDTDVPLLLSRAVLDRATFRLNRLQGLTVAVLSAADSGAIRFQDNTVTDCFGGVWFDSLALTDVAGAEDFQKILTQLENGNTDIASALQLAMLYPAPQALGVRLVALRPRVLPLAATSARHPVSAEKVRVFSLLSSSLQTVDSLKLLSLSSGMALSPRFHVANNQIDALPGDGSSSGIALLLVAGFGGNRDLQPDAASSVLVSANEFRNRGPASVDFTVLIFGATSNSLTANFILNEQTPAPTADPPVIPVSLFIVPGENGAMAVTGNVLNCKSNLDNFQRSDIQSFPTDTVPQLAQLNNWKFLNFEPLPPQPE